MTFVVSGLDWIGISGTLDGVSVDNSAAVGIIWVVAHSPGDNFFEVSYGADFAGTLFSCCTSVSTFSFTTSHGPIPEPSTLTLFATGIALLAFIGWRRRRVVQVKAA